MRTTIRFVTMCCLIVIFSIGFAPAWAADATVTDCTNFTGTGTISDAVITANSGGGTITFACGGTIIFTDQLIITDNVIINSNGNLVTFHGGNTTRFFTVSVGALLELDGFTLRNGRGTDDGGAIKNDGVLIVKNSTFARNEVTGARGGRGGAISNTARTGIAYISNSAFISNLADASGAISNNHIITISNSTFTNNRASSDIGAIGNFGRLIIYDSTFTGNSSYFPSGAIFTGVFAKLEIYGSTFTNNSSPHGGAIRNNGSTVSQDSHYENNTCSGNFIIIDNGGNTVNNAPGCPGN